MSGRAETEQGEGMMRMTKGSASKGFDVEGGNGNGNGREEGIGRDVKLEFVCRHSSQTHTQLCH